MRFCKRMGDGAKVVAGAFMLVAATAVQAGPITVIKDDILYTVHQDATYTMEETESFKVNTAQAVTQTSQVPLPFSDSLQKLEVLEAYTVTAAGTRAEVTPDKILTQQLPVSASAPTFSDYKVQVVVFPQVEVGATLTLHYRRTQLKPELPGVFSMRESYPRLVEYQAATLTLLAPAALVLDVNSAGVPGGETHPAPAGQRKWVWTLPQTTATTPEPNSVDMSDISPYVEASTLRSYADLARAYLVAARPAAKVTPAIQKQADDITQGISDKRAQVDALYRWVSQNIRYVAIFLNVGGYVPHNADAVLQVRYGDCKDHVALLEALLAAKGIRSSAVLISAGASYTLPKTAVLDAFNHAVTYLPEYHLFLDSTNPFATPGVLSDALNAKTALVTDAGQGLPQLMPTPLISDQSTGINVKTVATLAGDGSIKGSNVVSGRGVFDVLNRGIMGSLPKDQLAQVAVTLLARSGQNGTGTLKFGDPRDLSQPFSYEAQFELPARVPLPGPGAFGLNFGINLLGVGNFAASTAVPTRELPYVCAGGTREEVTQLTVPDGFVITALPKPVTVTSKVGSYESRYARDGSTVTITRKLAVHFAHPTCDAADYLETRTLATAAGQDLRAQALFQ